MMDVRIPHDLNAERIVLGSLVFDEAVRPKVVRELEPADFYSLAHRNLYEALISLFEEGVSPSTGTIVAALERMGRRNIESDAALTRVWQTFTTADAAEFYAGLIKDCSLKRSLQAIADEMIQECGDKTTTAADICQKYGEKFLAVQGRCQETGVVESWDDALLHVEREVRGELPPPVRYPTGIIPLNECLGGGLEQGTVCVVDGDTSSGKSAFAAQIALRNALDGARVAWFSYEMSPGQMIRRFIQHLGAISLLGNERAAHWEANPDLSDKLTAAFGKLAGLRVRLVVDRGLNTHGIEWFLAETQAREGKVDMMVVDYIQLMPPDKVTGSRAQEVSQTISRLHALAGKFSLAAIVVSQISNAARERRMTGSKMPSTVDQKESGDIAGVAEYLIQITGDRIGEIRPSTHYLTKNRLGKTGSVHTNFDTKRLVFTPRDSADATDDELPF